MNLAAKLGDNVDKGSKRLNISTDAYQEWSHALDQSGANINDLQRGIQNINKLLGGGEVTKSAAEAFEKLGIRILYKIIQVLNSRNIKKIHTS